MTKFPYESTGAYEIINAAELERVRLQHNWSAEPIYKASEVVKTLPFFEWVEELKSPQEFKTAAIQLYYHSATFPKVMGLMLGLTSLGENPMMPFYAKHAFGEADHHQMLMRWMLEHKILKNPQEIENVIPTLETNACVNLAYQLAIEQDRAKWIVTINSGIERCSNDFFKAVAPKMHQLGAGDPYFDVHVEADEHHSIMGMNYIESLHPESPRGRVLIATALEGVSLWAAMLHSWIDIDLVPHFELDGSLKKSNNSASFKWLHCRDLVNA